MKKIMEKKEIGKGTHWNVSRITTDKGTVIHKESAKGGVDENIENYTLVNNCGLSTLKRYEKIDNQTIETEDLNQNPKNGYFVTPNTIRNSTTCADILMKLISGKDISKSESEECIEFDFPCLVKNLTDGNIDILRNKKIISSIAEAEVYKNKIEEITNLDFFLNNAKIDMQKASQANIELFSDAFFYRVKPIVYEIEYIIADFDCIIHHCDEISEEVLFNGNMEYLKTSLREFITYFVINKKHNEYFEIINKY